MTKFKVTSKVDGKKHSLMFDTNQEAKKQFNKWKKAVLEDGVGFARLETKEDEGEWDVVMEAVVEEDED